MKIDKIEQHHCFGGEQIRFKHEAQCLSCDMYCSIYLPPATKNHPVPVIYWLSGLTCNDENFVLKAGAQRYAAEHQIAIVCPDTSPRGDHVPDAPDNAYDLGLGAGFYVNATETPWQAHYQMYDYIASELPALIEHHFPVNPKQTGIAGHSMGGHGALVIGLRNTHRYHSISAFAPICAPTQSPWGQKAFTAYLGQNRERWHAYDACELLNTHPPQIPILVDQGTADEFIQNQLKPNELVSASMSNQYPINLRLHAHYDHSYYFIASFIGDHLAFHAKQLLTN